MMTSGPGTSSKALARRSSRPSPRWGITSKPGRSHGPGGPSSTTVRRATGVRLIAASVSISAASASRAAWVGESGGHRRVLLRPGAGAFAITARVPWIIRIPR